MSQPAFKLERVLYRRKQSDYCGFRRLGIALDTKRNLLHHALVHEEGIACVDVETGQTIRTIAMTGTSGAKDCSFSAPENLCCCAAGRTLVCFDSRQPTIALQLNEIESAISAISCSNDGRYVAYASSDSTVGLFSLRMGCVVRPGLFHTSSVNSCWFEENNSGFWTAVRNICDFSDSILMSL
jgi:WD40 repeat protein